MKQTVIIVSSALAMSSQGVLLSSQGFFDSVTKSVAQVAPTELTSAVEAVAAGDVEGAVGGATAVAADQVGGEAGQIIDATSDTGLGTASAIATGCPGEVVQTAMNGSGNILDTAGLDGAGSTVTGLTDLATSDVLNMQSGDISGIINDSTSIANQLSTGQPAVAAAPLPQEAMVPQQPQAPVPQAPLPQAPVPQAPVPQAPVPQAPVPQAPVPQAMVPQQPQAIVPLQQAAVVPQQQAAFVPQQQQAVIPQQQVVAQASPVLSTAVADSTLISAQNGLTESVTTQANSGLLPGVYTMTVV